MKARELCAQKYIYKLNEKVPYHCGGLTDPLNSNSHTPDENFDSYQDVHTQMSFPHLG